MGERQRVFEGVDWAAGTDRGYHVVTIGPDATPEDVQAFRDAYELGTAWAEAEAALPEGWTVYRVEKTAMMDQRWQVEAQCRIGPVIAWNKVRTVIAEGSTPAAALRALAAKLRERAQLRETVD